MSDIFTFDTDGQKSLAVEAALNPLDVSQAQAGFFTGTGKGVREGIMRGGAKAAQAIAIADSAPLVAYEKLTDQEGRFTDPYFKAVDEHINSAVDYWTPTAAEVGKAGQVLGGLSEIALPLMAGGGNPSLLIGTQGLSTSTELTRQGVDAKAAVGVGSLQALAAGIGFKLPFLGKTLTSRIASGAAGNLAVNAGTTALQQQVLESLGEDEAAKQFDPMNLEARVVDVLTGIAFGSIAHLQMRPSDRAAVAAANNAKHFQQDTAPGLPADIESSVAHQRAMEQATEQMLKGEPVTVPAEIAEATFIRPVRPEVIPVDDLHVAALEPRQQVKIREMYREAEAIKPHFDEQVSSIAKEIQGKPYVAPLKGTARAVEKILTDYRGDASQIRDVLRATVVAPDISSAALALESARAKFGEPIGLRNGLSDTARVSADGYRDIKFNVRVNGHVAELQINVPEMLAAKGKAHPLYEKARSIDARAKAQGRDVTTEEALEQIALAKQQREIYAAAWEAASTKTRNSGSETSVPLWENDEIGNRRGSGVSQARQTPVGSNETGTPSTSANSVPAGKVAGSIDSPPGESIAQAEHTADSFDINTAQQVLEVRDLQIPTGEIDADGVPVTVSARELMAQAQEDVLRAQHEAQAFGAAVSCFLQGG